MICSVCKKEMGGAVACTASQICVQCAYGAPPSPHTLHYYIYYRADMSYKEVTEPFVSKEGARDRYFELMDPVCDVQWARHRGIVCTDNENKVVLLPIPGVF